MKRLTLSSLFVVLALLLSSCSMHLGLSKILGGGSTSKPSASKPNGLSSGSKHVKATHTPPSPSSASAGGAAQGNDLIMVTSSGFQPTTLTVKVGTQVTWTNSDTAAQSVTSDTVNLFDSGSLNPGATFQYTFSQAGTFTYHSTNAPADTGTVIVTP